MSPKIRCTKSTGNVFVDMEFEDGKVRLVKAKLALIINAIIKDRELKQAVIPAKAGIFTHG